MNIEVNDETTFELTKKLRTLRITLIWEFIGSMALIVLLCCVIASLFFGTTLSIKYGACDLQHVETEEKE